MNKKERSLWNRFVTLAQPYFFPTIRGGNRVMLLLLIMLLIFLFGVLFVAVSGIILAGNYFCIWKCRYPNVASTPPIY